MNIVDTNIEYLTVRLEGVTKLMDLVLQEMERESQACGNEDARVARFFLERTKGIYVDCWTHLLVDIEEINEELKEEIGKLYAASSQVVEG